MFSQIFRRIEFLSWLNDRPQKVKLEKVWIEYRFTKPIHNFEFRSSKVQQPTVLSHSISFRVPHLSTSPSHNLLHTWFFFLFCVVYSPVFWLYRPIINDGYCIVKSYFSHFVNSIKVIVAGAFPNFNLKFRVITMLATLAECIGTCVTKLTQLMKVYMHEKTWGRKILNYFLYIYS